MSNQLRKRLSLLACALMLLMAGGCRSVKSDEALREDTVQTGASVGHDGMVFIEGGTFRMGSEDEMPDESPAHEVTVAPFWMDAREVSVGEFSKFVEATGYKTDAEAFGWSGVFDRESGEWTRVEGADWRHPEGPA